MQPNVMLMSAKLKTGEKNDSENISVTSPNTSLSVTFPIPPDTISVSAVFIPELKFSLIAMKKIIPTDMTAENTVSGNVNPENIPHAPPLFTT